MEFGKLKGFWKSNHKHGDMTKQKTTSTQNGFSAGHANSNHNNSNAANRKDTLEEEIEPEVTTDGYGLRTPYGTHLNLDFLKYCDDISQGRLSQQQQSFRRPRTSSTSKSRHLRVNNALSTESLDSVSSDASEHAENTLMETRRRLEAFRSFRTKRKPSDPPNQIKSPNQKNMSSPPWSSQGLSSGQMTPTGFSGMLSSINSLPPQQYQHVREQMVAALKRLKELESQVKQIPVLQVQLSVLQQEKRNLANDINKMKQAKTSAPAATKEVTLAKENTPPPPPPKRKYKSVASGDEIQLQNIVCYAIGDQSFSTLTPTKHFVHATTECPVTPSATIATQCDDYVSKVRETKDSSVQCSPETTTTSCDAIKLKVSSATTQVNIALPSRDVSMQFRPLCETISCNTDTFATSEIGVMCKSETCSVSMNTDCTVKAEMCSQGTETANISVSNKGTETLPVETAKLVDTCVGNHIEYNTMLCGSDAQLPGVFVTSQSQTDDIFKPQLTDACTGNHIDYTTTAAGNHADYASIETGNHKEYTSIATTAAVQTHDMCVGEHMLSYETHTQSETVETCSVAVSACVKPDCANASCGTEQREFKNTQVQCKPTVANVFTEPCPVSCSEVATTTDNSILGGKWCVDKRTTEVGSNAVVEQSSVFTEPCPVGCSEVSTTTDNKMLGGKWTVDKQTTEVGSNAVVHQSNVETNTKCITKRDSSSQIIISTNDNSTAAKPDTVEVCTETCNDDDVSQFDKSSKPHEVEASAGDYLTIEKYNAPLNKSGVLCVSVATDTCGLSENQTTNELNEYVEKVNSLLEEQQSLLASNFVGLRDDSPDKAKEDDDANNDPPIKSIMRRPGSFSSEKKQLRFAEGVKSDDDDDDSSDSCTCSEEEESCSECSSDESSTVDEDENSSKEQLVEDAVVQVSPIDVVDAQPSVKEEPQKSEIVEVEQPKEEPKQVVKTSCITNSFLDACDVVDLHMRNPRSVSKLDFEDAITFLSNKWMAVAAQKESSDYHVEEFVDKLSQTSRNLLMKVVNLTDDSGNTALHYAISHGNFAVVSTLLDVEELRVNKFNQAGFTATMLAALTSDNSPNHISILKKLFKRADVNSHAKQAGQTALMLAVSHGRVECSEALLEAGADVNAQDVEGSTALMCAAEHGYTDIVKILIAQQGCNSTIADHDGSTALNIALERENHDIAVLLYAQMNFSKAKFNSKLLSPRNTDTRQPLLSNKPGNSLKLNS